MEDEKALYDYLASVSVAGRKITSCRSTTRVRNGKDLYGSYHFARFYYPHAHRDTLERFQTFLAPDDMRGWTVYEFGCCLGALSLECVRRGARVRAWDYHQAKVLGCQRLAERLKLSPDQVAFYQQDLIPWLRDAAAAQEFERRFPPADLTICCALNAYIPKSLRPQLYSFLARSTKDLCWFESNSHEPAELVVTELKRAGFSSVQHVGSDAHRQALVARTQAVPTIGELDEPVRNPTGQSLSPNEQKALEKYIQAFLSEAAHRKCFEQNPQELFRSLMDPDRLSIALMPVDKHISATGSNRAVNTWYFKYVKRYSRYHKTFINQLSPVLKRKLYKAKLLRHGRERNIRDFLSILCRSATQQARDERRFFDGLDLDANLITQGVEVADCLDYSSGRGYDEGAIVNKIVLRRNGGRVGFFLKGLGKVRKQKLERSGLTHYELFEVTAFEAARLVGLNCIESQCYCDDADPAMIGYTLLQEIHGLNSNQLFYRLPNHEFRISPRYARFRDRLIQEFARVAALGDLLRKGDRKIFQPIHPEYDANYLVNLEWLEKQEEKDSICLIDNNHLFHKDSSGIRYDIRHGKCVEIGIVAAFEEFYTDPKTRETLLARYEQAYLEQWAKIRDQQPALKRLISGYYGKTSTEYKRFQQSLLSDPRQEFEAQKAELLSLGAGNGSVKLAQRGDYRLIGEGFHGRVFQLSPRCCIKVFKDGEHAEMERRSYETAPGCPYIPKLYEAGPNYIIIEYVGGESLKQHIKRAGQVSRSLTKQILALLTELKRLGFTRTDFALRHLCFTEDRQLKVIDLKNACTLTNDAPSSLLESLGRMGYLDQFLEHVKTLEPALYLKWKSAAQLSSTPRG